MGIRFFCPNGHKLNVKEFQAGRLGICPFCGARIQIPTQSTRPASKSAGRRGAGQATTQTLEHDSPESAQGSDSSPDILPGEPPSLPGDFPGGKALGPSTPAGVPSGSGTVIAPPTLSAGGRGPATTPPSAPVAAEVKFRSAPLQQPSPAPSPSPGQATPAVAAAVVPAPAAASAGPAVTAAPTVPAVAPLPAQPAAPEPADPIAEAPEMIWYVRPPSGGQFGPASGELMKTWLSEGRVSADSLVWREGWRDWQEAGALFPKLRNNQIIDFLETTPAAAVAVSSPAHPHRPKGRRSSDRSQIALLVGLSTLVMVLIFVLLWIVFRPS
jgi:hypothetical protein